MYEFRNAAGLSKATVIMLYLLAAASIVAAVSTGAMALLLSSIRSGTVVSEAAARAADQREEGVSIVFFLVFFAAIITYLFWINRASKNAHAISGDNMTITPGWAVGWHFVPFASLVKPFHAVVEIWKVSANPNDPESVLWPETLLRSWWALWLIANIGANISFRMVGSPDLGLSVTGEWIDVVSSVACAGTSILQARIVGAIQSAQVDGGRLVEVFA